MEWDRNVKHSPLGMWLAFQGRFIFCTIRRQKRHITVEEQEGNLKHMHQVIGHGLSRTGKREHREPYERKVTYRYPQDDYLHVQ